VNSDADFCDELKVKSPAKYILTGLFVWRGDQKVTFKTRNVHTTLTSAATAVAVSPIPCRSFAQNLSVAVKSPRTVALFFKCRLQFLRISCNVSTIQVLRNLKIFSASLKGALFPKKYALKAKREKLIKRFLHVSDENAKCNLKEQL